MEMFANSMILCCKEPNLNMFLQFLFCICLHLTLSPKDSVQLRVVFCLEIAWLKQLSSDPDVLVIVILISEYFRAKL